MKLKTMHIGRPSTLLGRVKTEQEQSSGLSNVAWFKLAEFVRRGEKERALSLYRLLTHSVSDKSFLKKLEADIWFAFDQKEAKDYYHSAAHSYKKEGRCQEALMIFEQLTKQYPETETYIEKAIILSDQLGWQHKKETYQKKLYHVLLKAGKIEKALEQFKAIEKQLKDAEIYQFYKQLVLAALTNHYAEQKIVKNALQKSIDGLLRSSADKELQQFLEEVKALNIVWHKDAVAYLKKQE